MRSLSFLLLAAPLVACGGDDDGGNSTPDAKVFMDAAIDAPPACAVDDSLGQIATGTMQARRMGDWFEVPTMGPKANRTVFYVYGVVATSTQTALDLVFVEYVKPTTGGFVTNSPLNFITETTSTTLGVTAFVLADVNPATESVAQVYFASSGSLTLQNIGEEDGSLITGSVSQTNFREINQMTGADVAGGCTTMLPSMTFALTQMAAAATGKTFDDGELPQATIDAAFRKVQLLKRQQAAQ
jgi:hypothetical protein